MQYEQAIQGLEQIIRYRGLDPSWVTNMGRLPALQAQLPPKYHPIVGQMMGMLVAGYTNLLSSYGPLLYSQGTVLPGFSAPAPVVVAQSEQSLESLYNYLLPLYQRFCRETARC